MFKLLISFLFFLNLSNSQFVEYYEKLNVDPGATTKEIRRAFKKLAIKMHPDKSDDPNAELKFREIAEIYDVLTDEDKRKTYDRYGEEGLKDKEEKKQQRGNNRRSWQFYQNEGLYDEDEEIVTFEEDEAFNTVYTGGDIWFVNFYSTMCSHCHTLAPAWREMAKQLDGLVNIGAVNCMTSGYLCNRQRLTGYPTMMFFRDGRYEKYSGQDRSANGLVKFILGKINPKIHKIFSKANLEKVLKSEDATIINFCSNGADCIEDISEKKLAAGFSKLAKFYSLNCDKIEIDCESQFGISSGIYAFSNGDEIKISTEDVLDPSEISKKLNPILYPKFDKVVNGEGIFDSEDENLVKVVVATRKTKNFEKNPTLLQIRKTKAFLEIRQKYKLVHYNCDEGGNSEDCGKFMGTNKWITVIVVHKSKFQQYLGTDFRAADIAIFTKEVVYTIHNLRQLTSADFDKTVYSGLLDKNSEGKHWFVDFYSPSCSPCRSFMQVMREAAKEYAAYSGNERIHFASVDCSLPFNNNLCNKYRIRSWPTGKLFIDGKFSDDPLDFDQHHNIEGIREFLEEAFNPSMTQLTPESFKELVQKREQGVAWMVKFGTRTCGPCRQIEQQMKILARNLINGGAGEFLKVGVIDCNDHYNFCHNRHFIETYPTVNIYPAKWTSGAYNSFETFDLRRNHRNHLTLGNFIADNAPGDEINMFLQSWELEKQALKPKPKTLYVVDFYANWCQPCLEFKPKFAALAIKWRKSAYHRAYLKNGWNLEFVAFDCARTHSTNNICQQAGVPHYPYVKVIHPAGRKYKTMETTENVDSLFEILLQQMDSAGAGPVKFDNEHDEL